MDLKLLAKAKLSETLLYIVNHPGSSTNQICRGDGGLVDHVVFNRIADLEQTGLISAEEGSYRGRPQYRYSATPKGHRLSELLQAIKKL